LARESEQPSGSGTIPSAELNPLLNPLLAENMGRWAEVYFTSAPERREQAVLELLRELEAQRAQKKETAGIVAAAPVEETESPSVHAAPPGFLPTELQEMLREDPVIRCHSCGAENPRSHRFCGMCGVMMGEVPPEAQPQASHQENDHALFQLLHSGPAPEAQSDERSSEQDAVEPEMADPSGWSLFQKLRERTGETEANWQAEEEPSRPYRAYIGAALAVVILSVAYVAWRGNQSKPGDLAQPASNAPASSIRPTSAPAPSSPPTLAVQQANAGAPAQAANHPDAQPSPASTAPTTAASVTNGASKPAPSIPAGAGDPEKASGRGGEELATAQQYLEGSNGQARNSAEAAKWLWKAIAKHNGEATLLLADLYMRGDGVSKNCDQARVLLDSAARKGVAGAGERLRILESSGCQ